MQLRERMQATGATSEAQDANAQLQRAQEKLWHGLEAVITERNTVMAKLARLEASQLAIKQVVTGESGENEQSVPATAEAVGDYLSTALSRVSCARAEESACRQALVDLLKQRETLTAPVNAADPHKATTEQGAVQSPVPLTPEQLAGLLSGVQYRSVLARLCAEIQDSGLVMLSLFHFHL